MFNLGNDKIKQNIEFIASIVGLFIGISFSLGFLIWNIYLQALGFSSGNFFQAKFILSGIAFMLITLLLFVIFSSFLSSLWNKAKTQKKSLFFVIPLVVLWPILYSYIVFPFIPGEFGGGFPRAVSLIASKDEIGYLNQFGIHNGTGSLIQTENLCVVYEDTDSVLIILNDRVLSLRKQEIHGFGSLPSIEATRFKFQCAFVVLKKMTNLERVI